MAPSCRFSMNIMRLVIYLSELRFKKKNASAGDLAVANYMGGIWAYFARRGSAKEIDVFQ